MVTYTVVRVPLAGFTEQTPLPIALVELMEGVQVMIPDRCRCRRPDLSDRDAVHLKTRRISWDGEAGLIFSGHQAVPNI